MYQPYVTKLPLAQFARFMGMNPAHIWGVQFTEIESMTCSQAVFTYEWQNSDAVSREEISRCIAGAEADIEAYLGYRLMPSWEEEEWRPFPQPYRNELIWRSPYGAQGRPQPVEVRWKHVLSGGRRGLTLIDANAAITWDSQFGGANYKDRGTVTVTVPAGTAACEIALYYPGKSGDEHHRIRPVTASIIGNTATIMFRRELAVKEELTELIAAGGNYIRPVAGSDDGNFLADVDVYRLFNDGETQATLLWYPPNSCDALGFLLPSADPSRIATQPAVLSIDEPELGFVAPLPAAWDAGTRTFSGALRALPRQPDAVRLFYYGGLVDQALECPLSTMSEDWARTVAILAAARLSRPLCACAKVNAERWQRDIAFSGGTGRFQIGPTDLDSPFGTLAGEIYAYRRVRRPNTSLVLAP